MPAQILITNHPQLEQILRTQQTEMLPDLEKPLDLSTLRDKSVLITGGASGIGALTATTFAEHGAHVTIADINKQQGETLLTTLKQKDLSINFIATDVTLWSSQVEAFQSAIAFSSNKSIDVVVTAAGLAGADFISPDEEAPSLDGIPPEPRVSGLTLDVNLKGTYYTAKLAQHYFALPPSDPSTAAGGPRKSLILISSLAGYLELDAADYTASKWAVRGLFRSIRQPMKGLGYRVNLIAPWVMDTPMSKPLADICRQNGVPVGNAQDVADAVVRCAVDDDLYGELFLFPYFLL